MTPGSLNRRSTFTMFKKAALTGCMLGVGMIMGAMLFGHQAGMQVGPHIFLLSFSGGLGAVCMYLIVIVIFCVCNSSLSLEYNYIEF